MLLKKISAGITPVAKSTLVNGVEDQAVLLSGHTFKIGLLQSIKITSLAETGQLLYKNTQGQWQNVSVGMEFSYLQLSKNMLKFVANENQFGNNYAQFNFLVKSGGNYSASPGEIKFNIAAVNDAPVAVNNTVSVNKTGLTHLSKSAFTFTDVDNTSITQVKITALSNPGSLVIKNPITDKLTVLKVGSIIKTTDLDNVYVNASSIKQATQSSFKFMVFDGQDWSNSKLPAVMTLNLTETDNKQITLSSSGGSLTEDTNVVNGHISTSGTIATNQSNLFIAKTETNAYGTFQIDANGHWSFTADNNSTVIQSLSSNNLQVFIFTVNTVSNLTTFVEITLTGKNETTSISGQNLAQLTEDTQTVMISPEFKDSVLIQNNTPSQGGGKPIPGGVTDPEPIESLQATGKLFATNPDIGTINFVPAVYTGIFGKLTIGQDGEWYYRAANKQSAIQALNTNTPPGIETFTVSTTDGITHTITITITGVNETPEVVLSNSLFEFQSDSTTIVGTLVSSLLIETTDGDNANVNSIALISAQTDNGHWEYSTDGTTWTQISAVSSANALLLKGSDYIRFLPNDPANFKSSASISYCAWDQSSGTAHSYVNVDQGQPGSAFSNQTVSSKFSFTAGSDQYTVDVSNWGADNSIDAGSGDDTVTLTSSNAAVTLTTQDLMRFENVEHLVLEDGHNWSLTLDDNSSIQSIDTSQLTNASSLSIDTSASSRGFNLTLNSVPSDLSLKFGSGYDTLVWSNNTFDNSFVPSVAGLDKLILNAVSNSVTLNDSFFAQDQNAMTLNFDSNFLSLNATGVSSAHKVYFESNDGTLNISGSGPQTVYASGNGNQTVNIDSADVTYYLGAGVDTIKVASNASNTVLVSTAANFNAGDLIKGYGTNTTLKLIDENNGNTNYFNPSNMADVILGSYLFIGTRYKTAIFTSDDNNPSGTHYWVNLASDYIGHNPLITSSYQGGSAPVTNILRYINYDASQLDSHDSIVVDARNFAADVQTTGSLSNLMTITIVGGAGDDTYYLPRFDQIGYKTGSDYLINNSALSNKISSDIQLGNGDDTFVLTVEKFSQYGTTFLYDGGSDNAGSVPEGLGHGDTLKIEGADRTVNLSDIGKYFANVEQIDLGTDQGHYTLSLTLNSVLNLSSTRDDLVIHGGNGDQVQLNDPSNWTQKADTEISGQSYHVYANPNNEDQKIYIQSDITIIS